MDWVSLCFGLGLGIIIGALCQERIHAGLPGSSGGLAALFKDACAGLAANETVSVTVTGSKYNDDGDGDGEDAGDFVDDVSSAMIDNWRNN